MGDLSLDLKYAFRVLAKSPGFTAVAILAMSLGIGANTGMFSCVNAYMLRGLPIPEPERLILISSTQPKQGITTGADYPTWQDWRRQCRSFSGIVAFQSASFSFNGDGSEPERYLGVRVSADYFTVLGARPFLGRDFLPEEDALGANRVAVIGYNLWQTRFGGTADVIGRSVQIDGNQHTIVGIMARGVRFPPSAEVYTPLAVDPAKAPRGRRSLGIVGRLRPGASASQALAELQTIGSGLAQQYPDTHAGWSVSLMDVREAVVRGPRPSLYILSAAVVFVLLIACANVANLLLARAAVRSKEIAIRSALGAGRLRVVRQMLTESVLLAMIGGVFGLVLSHWGLQALMKSLPSYMLPVNDIRIDAAVLSFTLALTVLAGVLFGLAPALSLLRPDVGETLKEGGRGTSSGTGRGRLRSAFIVCEVALSLVLLVGSALLIKSFAKLQELDLGFRSEGLMTMQIALPQTKYESPEQRSVFFRELLGRIERMAGVESAAAANALPMSGGNFQDFLVEGRPAPARDEVVYAAIRAVSPDYFRTLKVPLRRGRSIESQDAAGRLPVAVVNEAFVRRMFPDGEALGKRIRIDASAESKNPWLTIVGITGDIQRYGVNTEAFPEISQSYLQAPPQTMSFAVRVRGGDPTTMAPSMRALVRAMDADQPVASLRSMESLLGDQIAVPRNLTMLLSICAGIALLLAVMGIYGVIAYSVNQRSHEIGIRMALGASRNQVTWMVVGQALKLATAGVAIGLVGAFGITRLLAAVLYGVSPQDAAVFTLVPLSLAVVAVAASYLPARRASRVDPLIALRYE